MFTFAKVAAYLEKLPGVTIGASYGHKTWQVNGRAIAWERAFSKADIARFGDEPVPDGEILAVSTGDLDAKDGLFGLMLPGFFTIPHFNNYPALLIQLKKAIAEDVRMALDEGYKAMLAKGPAKPKRTASPSSRARSSRPRAARSSPRPRAK